jgi:hypothetical protein
MIVPQVKVQDKSSTATDVIQMPHTASTSLDSKKVALNRMLNQTEKPPTLLYGKKTLTESRNHPNGCGICFESSEPFWRERVWGDDRNAVNHE